MFGVAAPGGHLRVSSVKGLLALLAEEFQVRVVARDTDLQKICRSRALARDLRIFCRSFVELYNPLVGRGAF